ncbi:unnamed protein product [Gongylonema pulchrum]|uniref:Uncharacterized protein n=1 Tax=Gongylonema pulchrum TaxID=637853 RepID=A0A183E6C0_9BILA|nr:unnamed protein product [Gongylonema pulchrum]
MKCDEEAGAHLFVIILGSGSIRLPKTAPQDALKHPDTSETVYISSLALLKMLRHGRAGVPMEVNLLKSVSTTSLAIAI